MKDVGFVPSLVAVGDPVAVGDLVAVGDAVAVGDPVAMGDWKRRQSVQSRGSLGGGCDLGGRDGGGQLLQGGLDLVAAVDHQVLLVGQGDQLEVGPLADHSQQKHCH